ncbi:MULTISPECIES: S66 peptidase family protein [Caloramator]|uniref:Muramoyltetrapeptide carboxypeptidase n=1 Tax=Caloramator proteoclasticus DSM 10124 TaxID=1121262 RepID=A0A1M4SSC4_9CLOT|nr:MULTISPECIES: LD-carboxypeptidase [Caloramator]SHE34897.1 muramoyltetrapeptide carboxypeptidase [Caloramator proteoclasticus DSM 10124]
MSLIKKLNKGDKVSLIAPAGAIFNDELIKKSIQIINEFGYSVKLGKNINSKYGYLAGEDNKRVEDLIDAFKDKEVKAIFCIRGGYGTIRLLDKINYNVIKNNKKIFVGYSDITSLHASFSHLDFPTFHGPMFSYDIFKNNDNYNLLFEFLEGRIDKLNYALTPIREGNIEGKIVGGNLCVLCSLIGTQYQYKFKNSILFIEEINEEPYKIDRFLNQLYHSNILNEVEGIILGSFTNCNPEDKNRSFSFEYIYEYIKELTTKPIYFGLQSGHDYTNKLLPLNITAKIIDNKLIINKGEVFID